MAEVQEARGLAGIQALLEQMQSYKQVLENEQAAQQAVQEEHAREEQEASRELEALVEAAYLVAAADGRVSEAERHRLVERVGRVTGGRFSAAYIEEIMQGAAERVHGEGAAARAEEIAAALPSDELRRAALLVASAVAWLDGGVKEREGLALQALARAFGISTHEMQQILGQAHG
ncbi:MAG: TerB family tellurite resistance protein [Polyangiaceae bacterium]|nr:TerB family tellurite resistance protein [Polyangiaceae bacterium]